MNRKMIARYIAAIVSMQEEADIWIVHETLTADFLLKISEDGVIIQMSTGNEARRIIRASFIFHCVGGDLCQKSF